MTITEKRLGYIRVAPGTEKVKIRFQENRTKESEEGDSPEDSKRKIKHGIDSDFVPHKDLTDSLKKLRKFALEIVDIEVDSKKIGDWTVSALTIKGDYILKQSRCIMTLAKLVPTTGKWVEFTLSEIAMYPEKDAENRYHNAEKMSPIIEDIIEEAFSYMNGKFADGLNELPLFPTLTTQKFETNFSQ